MNKQYEINLDFLYFNNNHPALIKAYNDTYMVKKP